MSPYRRLEVMRMGFVAIVEAAGACGLYDPVDGSVTTRRACERSLEDLLSAGGPEVVSWNTPTGDLSEEQEEILFEEGYKVVAVLDLRKYPSADALLNTATVVANICHSLVA
jgi:hypothetical protein